MVDEEEDWRDDRRNKGIIPAENNWGRVEEPQQYQLRPAGMYVRAMLFRAWMDGRREREYVSGDGSGKWWLAEQSLKKNRMAPRVVAPVSAKQYESDGWAGGRASGGVSSERKRAGQSRKEA